MDYLVRIGVRRSRLEGHPITRWPGNILPSWSHVVAAGRSDSSLAEAVHPGTPGTTKTMATREYGEMPVGWNDAWETLL